jgi:LmbE family N-acetylglucosaminyl deacetylase
MIGETVAEPVTLLANPVAADRDLPALQKHFIALPQENEGDPAMKKHGISTGIILTLLGFVGGWLLRGTTPPVARANSAASSAQAERAAPANDGKLRIIAFGAHPDDCELKAGGVAAKWAALGHHVKIVSVTNGDIGHWRMAGGPLARRRTAEVQKCARILGIDTHVLDIHDGELEPTLANCRTITRLIRDWKADIVLAHRPNDYHPDHRYTGILVQDAAYMVTVPFFCPDTPYLEKNPAFLYYSDRFQRPNPFRPDIVVDIDDVIEKKLDALDVLESQFLEGGANGSADQLRREGTGAPRRAQLRQGFRERAQSVARHHRAKLVELYGKEQGAKVQHAEAFELCEYGAQPRPAELRGLFPLHGKQLAPTPR